RRPRPKARMQSSPCDSTLPRWEATGPRSAPTVRLSVRAKERERNGLRQTGAAPTRGQRESPIKNVAFPPGSDTVALLMHLGPPSEAVRRARDQEDAVGEAGAPVDVRVAH